MEKQVGPGDAPPGVARALRLRPIPVEPEFKTEPRDKDDDRNLLLI